MDIEEAVRRLRTATEDDVEQALKGAKVGLPLTTAYEALEFFNCLIDVMTDVREREDSADRDRIQPGFGSTH